MAEVGESNPVSPFQEVVNLSKVKSTSNPSGNIPSDITVPESTKVTPAGTKSLASMPSDCIEKIYSEEGFRENTPAHLALERHFGFGYRNLLGELMYIFISSRPDIGYAVTTMSKFSTCPGKYHFTLLKGVARYLKHTINWGIRFHQPRPLTEPFPGAFSIIMKHNIPEEKNLLKTFDIDINTAQLKGFVDAAHANNLRKRRSTI